MASLRLVLCAHVDSLLVFYPRRWGISEALRVNLGDGITVAKVGTAYDRAADRSCQPMEDAVSVKFESAFKKVVDFYLATPVSASWNRAEALRSLERGERELAQ